MSQTPEGAIKAKATIIEKYGKDYFANMGKLGGQKSTSGGFGQGEMGRERARIAGAKGGRVSRRKPAK